MWFLIPASVDVECCQHPLQVLTIYWRIVFPLSPASVEKIGGFATKTDETMENVHKIDFLAFLSPGRREKH